MTPFEIVVAADEENGIGKDSALPWELPGDMAHFRRITRGDGSGPLRSVIMGRKTWESVPSRFQPLPDRRNLVLTRQPGYALPEGVLQARSLEEALETLGALPELGRVFVIGGGEVYRQALALPACRRIHLTRIHARFDCDTFFPDPGPAFVLRQASETHEENGIRYEFQDLERRP